MINYLCSRDITDKYVACIIFQAETLNKDPDNQPMEMENGFLWETDSDEEVENSSEVGLSILYAPSYIRLHLSMQVVLG